MEELNNLSDIFEYCKTIDITEKIEDKLGLKYYSWANAWDKLCSTFKNVEKKIYTRQVHIDEVRESSGEGAKNTVTTSYDVEVPYFTDGITCWVKVGVIINGQERIETLPIMNLKNAAIKLSLIDSVSVNRALQRCFVKAAAAHGLGLFLYQGEDVPEAVKNKAIEEMNELVNLADQIKVGPADKEEFEKDRQAIITVIQNGTLKDNEIVTSYIQEQLKGTRISQTTFEQHGLEIKKIKCLIDAVGAKK